MTRCVFGELSQSNNSARPYDPRRAPLETLVGGDPAHNAALIVRLLEGETGPRRDAVLYNAAAGFLIAGRAPDLRAGVRLAAETIDSKAALRLLEKLRADAGGGE